MAHHLVLGELSDYLTGEIIADTHDERYRQKVARLLVEDKGYAKEQIAPRLRHLVEVDGRRQQMTVDFAVSVGGKAAMVVCYGPGSIVSRQRPSLARARTLGAAVVPLAVVTNGRDAEVLDVETGRVRATGFDGIPSRAALEAELGGHAFSRLSERQRTGELRILMAFDALDCCCARAGAGPT